MFFKRFLIGTVLAAVAGLLLTISLMGAVSVPLGSGGPAEARTAVLSGGVLSPLPEPPGSHALATPPGTVNFQGLLTDGSGVPVPDGNYSIRFSIWDDASVGTEVWNETQPTVAVAGGLFSVQLGSVTALGGAEFNGTPRYLEVKVGVDSAMTPRLAFDTVPYAFHALSADLANSAELLDGLASSDFWKLSGNSGTTAGTDFLGTTDSEPLELHVNNVRGLRLEPVPAGYGPNVVGGFSANSITSGVRAGTIGGGGNAPNGSNRVTDDYGTVSGGINNRAGDDAGNTFSTDSATVGGGNSNTASGNNSTVSGGKGNTASNARSTVGGGEGNTASGSYGTVGGGILNTASGEYATVGGGRGSNATADYATIAGGGRSDPNDLATGNRVTDDYGTVGGGGNNQAGDAAGTTADRTYATVGGGLNNTASGSHATAGGGDSNTASGFYSAVGGGQSNIAGFYWATVGGGHNNSTSVQGGTVGGGESNTVSGLRGTVAGGILNTASSYATVGGGEQNTASGSSATISGGTSNTASGQWATVGGGRSNSAAGDLSFAAGRQAKIAAVHDGSFLFADDSGFIDFNSAAANEFAVRSTGGARFVSAIDGGGNPTAGVTLADGGGSWASISDRSVKANFAPADGRDILERLASVPIETWNLKSQDTSIRHIGPMAQEFYAAFAVGEDDTHITTVDADGVALAAIQGLYELAQEQEAQIAALQGAAGANGAGTDGAASGSSSSGLPATWLLLGGLLLAGLVLGSVVTVVARWKVS